MLAIGAEVLTSMVNWEDRSTCVLFGDGAGAAVLHAGTGRGIVHTRMGAEGALADLEWIAARPGTKARAAIGPMPVPTPGPG